jgi:hypothetical protein
MATDVRQVAQDVMIAQDELAAAMAAAKRSPGDPDAIAALQDARKAFDAAHRELSGVMHAASLAGALAMGSQGPQRPAGRAQTSRTKADRTAPKKPAGRPAPRALTRTFALPAPEPHPYPAAPTPASKVRADLASEFRAGIMEWPGTDRWRPEVVDQWVLMLIDSANGKFTDALYPENKRARALFESVTGVKLPKTIKGTKEAIAEYASSRSQRNPVTGAMAKTLHRHADTFAGKVAYVRKHMPGVVAPEAFVGAALAAERKAKRRGR